MLRTPLRRFASTVNSVVFQKYGNPASVLKTQATQLKTLCCKDVQIKMVLAGVSSYDLDAISGKSPVGYGFPSVAGSEGVGIVEKVGQDVKSVKENDMVMFIKPYQGTWTEKAVVSEDSIMAVPTGVAPEMACALLNSAGTAYNLLSSFVNLKSGDVLVQNDACSPVGKCVIQLCKARGIKTINIVKDLPKCKCSQGIEAYGGDIIIHEKQLDATDLQRILKGLPPVKLVLNGRGGSVMTTLGKMMKNTTIVTYNESSYEPFTMSGSEFTTQSLSLNGFNMNSWLQNSKKEDIESMVNDLAASIRNGELKLEMPEIKFDDVNKYMETTMNGGCKGTRVMKL